MTLMNNTTTKELPLNSQVKLEQNANDSSVIRILIVDDQNFARQRLQMLLESESDFQIVGNANDGSTAIDQIASLQPDIVLMDLEMPGMDGIKATEIISKRFPNCKVLVFSIHESEEYLNKAFHVGAKGYLPKSTPQKELIQGIRSLQRGYPQISLELFERLMLAKKKAETAIVKYTETAIVKSTDKDFSKLTLSQPKAQNKLFRQESLERLASPERLDQLMRVVNPKSWIPLVTLGSVVLATAIWSVVGRIPITVDGQGVLIYPSKVVPLQTQGSGQLTSLKIEEGDLIRKGDILATVDQVDLRKKLQLAQDKLKQLRSQNDNAESIQNQRQNQDTEAIEEQRQTLQERLDLTQSLAPVLKTKGLESIQSDRTSQEEKLNNLQQLLPTYKKRLEIRENLFNQGAISDDVLLEARQQYLDNIASENETKSQLKKLEVEEADALKEYLSNLNEIKDIQAQLQELDSQTAQSTQQDSESSTNRQKEIQEVEREIAQLQEQLKNESQIVSQYTGRVLETTVSPGQVIEAGTRIANIDIRNLSGKLVGITYFSVEDGKKIQPDMTIQITPQTVKRERFGGIMGDITKVSAFPISKEAAAKVIGNSEVVEGLVSDKEQGVLQVFATPYEDSDTFSGYKWSSSSGPNLKVSSGTPTSVRVKVEERAPVTFILPILRSISGIY
jgi:HlyD family secretion protein